MFRYFLPAIAWALLLGGSDVRPLHAQASPVAVDLELVLAIDCSTSVDEAEFDLQWRGLQQAFLHPAVIGAIQAAGDRGVAVSLIQWSGPSRQRMVVDWMLVKDADDAARLAERIGRVSRTVTGFTDIAGAIRFSAASLAGNGFDGFRKVIDISGDGSSDSASVALERDRAVAAGITVNGLVIYSEDFDLGALANIDVATHYASDVIGGPGAFMMTADDFADFQIAIRRKLVREISGPATAVNLHSKGARPAAR